MVTKCELQIEAKSLGLKGYSKLKKADLMKLVDGEDKPKPKAKKEEPKPKAKKEEPKPKAKKEEPKLKKKSPEFRSAKYENKTMNQLIKIREKIEPKLRKLMMDKGATEAEKERAKKKLKELLDAIEKKRKT
jgi:hypothetical protein